MKQFRKSINDSVVHIVTIVSVIRYIKPFRFYNAP